MRFATSPMPLYRRHYWMPDITATIVANGGKNVDKDAKDTTQAVTAGTTEKTLAIPDPDTFIKLVRRAEKGDAKALADVRAACKREPKLWNLIGLNAADITRQSLIKLIVGENLIAQDLLDREIDAMEKALLGAYPSPLERLLVERICLCYLQVQYAEIAYAQQAKGTIALSYGDYLQRQVDRANQRYTAAIRTLAQVRRLLTPLVQVNVAEKQVNLAGAGANVLNAGASLELPIADVMRGRNGA